VTLVKLNADENKPEKKRFPWHTVTIVSGAILLVGGGTLALWNYPKYTDRDERATDWIKKYCPDETRSGLVCGEKSDQQMVNELWDARDHFGRYALTGGIIAGVGVGLIALGLFVLQPPSDDSKSAASSAGRGAVRAAPTPGLSESPILDIVPVIAPSNYGLILNGTF
jgi:hypothetical protein